MFVFCFLESELEMPDSQINIFFYLIAHMGLQKCLKLFMIKGTVCLHNNDVLKAKKSFLFAYR